MGEWGGIFYISHVNKIYTYILNGYEWSLSIQTLLLLVLTKMMARYSLPSGKVGDILYLPCQQKKYMNIF